MKILWKYYSSISQLEFYIFYIIFPFSISLSTTCFISFSFFSPPHVVHYLYPSFTLLSSSFSLIHQNVPGALSFSSSLSLFFFFFLLDSKTLSVIRKFSFPLSFKNILGSSHLRPQPSPDGSAGFCPLSFFCFLLLLLWFD